MKYPYLVIAITGLTALCALAEETELDKRLAALKAAGEPIFIEDFQNPTVDPKDNAAVDIEAAVKALKQETPEYNALDNRDESVHLPLTDFEIENLLQISKQNQEALALLASAAKKPQNVAQIKLKTPAFETLLPGLNGARACANQLGYEVYNQYAMGMYDLAFERLMQFKLVADYSRSCGFLVGLLVANGIEAMRMDRLIMITPEIGIGSDAHQVPRQQIEKYVTELMDQTECKKEIIRAIQSERSSSIDTVRALLNQNVTPKQKADLKKIFKMDTPENPQQRAILEQNALHLLDYYNDLLMRIDGDDNPAAQKKLKESTVLAEIKKNKADPNYALANVIVPSLDRVAANTFTRLTNREAAAAALAIRLYRIDNKDQFPLKLEDLVPKYLSRVPRDYMADNKPLNYRTGDKPILWSVWQDGKDNGGQKYGEIKTSKEFDQVFPLTIPPRMEAGN